MDVMDEGKPLLVLMDEALKSKEMFQEYASLEEMITNEKECAGLLRKILDDQSFVIPNGKHYDIAQGRAEHSVINYALGLVFKDFADLFNTIDYIMAERMIKDKKGAEEAWFSVALNHDVGYFSKHILDENFDYSKEHKYNLYKDVYKENYEIKYNCLNGMSSYVPELYAFTYEEILEYDEKDRIRRKKSSDYEKINHGIYGGAYFFDKMLRKFDRKGITDKEAIKMVKAVAITIAQHNLYKSNSVKNNYFYPSKLHYESTFVIDKKYPLLLFLALIDTIECVKKLGKTNNRKSFFQAKTVLKSISVKVNLHSIDIDYSELKSRLVNKKNESLNQNYNSYIEGVKGLSTWTCLKVECTDNEDVIKIYMDNVIRKAEFMMSKINMQGITVS